MDKMYYIVESMDSRKQPMDMMYYIVESMNSRWTRCTILLSLWTADGQDVLYC